MSKKEKENGKLTLGEVIYSGEPLTELLEQKVTGVVPFRLARVARELSPILEDYDKAKTSLYGKYGEEIDGKVSVSRESIGDDKWKEFIEEMNAILSEEIKMEIPSITEEELGIFEINGNDVLALGWLIKE